MPLQHPSLIKFNAGQWSDKLRARNDLEDYDAACELMTGFIPLKYGEAQAMTGFIHGEETKNNAKVSIMKPFQFSANDSFWLEFGDQYMRVVNPSDGTYVETAPDTPFELATPYLEADLYDLQVQPLNDLVVVTHTSYPPKEINRVTDTNWTISDYQQDYPAFLSLNTDSSNKIAPSGTTGSINLVASGGHTPFTADHEDSYWAITHTREASETEQVMGTTDSSSAIPTKGNWFFYTKYPPGATATFNDTIKLQRSIDGGSTWSTIRERTVEDYDIAIDISGTEEEEGVNYRIDITNNSGAPTANSVVVFATEEVQVTGIAQVTGFTSDTSVPATVLSDFPFESTSASSLWKEGAWSDVQGYPKASTVFEQRMIFGGTTQKPTGLWMSKTDDISNFDFSDTSDTGAIFVVIDNSQNEIQWLSRKDRIFVGTAGEEFAVSSSNLQEAITPTNITVKTAGGNGSASIEPISLGGSLAFVTLNKVQVRELSYSLADDAYNSLTDLTELADDITGTGIKQIAYQQYPNRTVYCIRNDGTLLGLVYDKQNKINAWFTRTTDGEIESVVSTRSGGGINDPLGIIVKRTINGTEKRFIEVLAEPSATNTEWVYLDGATEFAALGGTSVTGLDHLEGKTVRVMNDGALETDKTVVSGAITLDRTSSVNTVVGLDYDAEFITLPIAVNTGDGNPKIKPKSCSHVMLGVRDSLNGKYGYKAIDDKGDAVTTLDTIFPIDTGDRIMGTALPPTTRYYRLEMDGGHWREFSFRIKREDPVPINVTHAIPAMQATGD